MNSHELARRLLELPDLPVATHALNHTYMAGLQERTHGGLKVGLLHTYGGDHIVIGDIGRKNLNHPNWYVKTMYIGSAPEDYPRY